MRPLVVLLLALAACGDGVRVVEPPPTPAGVTYVALKTGRVTEASTFAALPDPWRVDLADGESLFVLVFPSEVARELVPDSNGKLALLPASASSDEAWELRPPTAAYRLDGSSFVEADVTALLAPLRFERPACPPLPRFRPISGLEGVGDLSAVIRFGDDVVIGGAGTTAGAFFRLRPGQASAEPLVSFPSPQGHAHPVLGFVDERYLHLVGLESAEPRTYRRVVLDRNYLEVSRHTFGVTGAIADYVLTRLEAGRFEGALTVVARARQYFELSGGGAQSHLLAFDPDLSRAQVLVSGPRDDERCTGVLESMVLEVDGAGRGLAGLFGLPVSRFDVRVSGSLGAPYFERPLCRSARAPLEGGAEMFVYQGVGGEGDVGLVWRSATSAWRPLPTPTAVVGQRVGTLGELALVTGAQRFIAVYETTPRRPELPPRHCGELVTGSNPYFAANFPDGALVFAGNFEPRVLVIEPN